MSTNIANSGGAGYPGTSGLNLMEVHGGSEATEWWGAYGPFTVSAGTWAIDIIKVDLWRVLTNLGAPAAGNVLLELRSGAIDGALVTEAVYDRTTLTEETHVFAEFNPAGTPNVSSGTNYYLILKDPAGTYSIYNDPVYEYDYVQWRANPATSVPCLQHNSISGWTAAGTKRLIFQLWADMVAASKPTDPTPEHTSTGVDFSDLTLSWEDGGGSDTYDVYIGPSGDMSRVSLAQAGTSFVVDISDVPLNQVIYWRVDATNGAGTTTGDIWNFDARPVKATTPAPTDAAEDVTLDQETTTWEDGGNSTSYNVYYGDTSGDLTLASEGQEDLSFTVNGITLGSPYDYIITRYWRIDSINAFGTTTGDEWSFTTLRFTPPEVTYYYCVTNQYYQLLVQSDGTYGDPPGIGVEDTDYVFLAAGYLPNFINTNRKLVAAAKDTIWYEDV